MRRRPYPAPHEKVEEIGRQIQECIDAGLVEEYKEGDYPHHCKKVFMSLSAVKFIVPVLLLAAGVGFLLLVSDEENVLLMKYNQFRIPQARDEEVEDKQDQSMKGCSQKRVR